LTQAYAKFISRNSKLSAHAHGTVLPEVQNFSMDISLDEEEKLQGWMLPVNTSNQITIQRQRIDNSWIIPEPANFKIMLDSTISTSTRLNHVYTIEEATQENDLVLSLTPPNRTPGKFKCTLWIILVLAWTTEYSFITYFICPN